MESGYIYALKNKSFCESLIKIGRTTRKPEIRAKEFYSGSSGIPESFDIAFACQVFDCVIAEKKIHQRLKTYRNNNNREFFTISIEVAKKIILNVCEEINKLSGCFVENIIVIDTDHEIVDSENPEYKYIYDSYKIIELEINNFSNLSVSQPFTSYLNEEQKHRIEIIAEIFNNLLPGNTEHWKINFSRDVDPEIEIFIWENIAKAFLKISQIKYLSEEQKEEGFDLLLIRSMMSPSKVFEKFKLKTLSKKVAKEILRGYEINPIPIAVIKDSAP
jgi:hypothetical protein